MAGDPNGTPPDTPADRVDPNTTSSPWAGIGSVFFDTAHTPAGVGNIGTGIPISSRAVLTAAHTFDDDRDGVLDRGPEFVRFVFNYGGDRTHILTPTFMSTHYAFTGFGRPSVNDDLVIMHFAEDFPIGIPIYEPATELQPLGTTAVMVGYGATGSGTTAGYVGPDSTSFRIKRVGQNNIDQHLVDDEGSGRFEVFKFDFDAPDGTIGTMGGASLGNDIETLIGPGDSGGPSFVWDTDASDWRIYGVNSFFSEVGVNAAPVFGTQGGGLLVPTYVPWLDAVLNPVAGDADRNGAVDLRDLDVIVANWMQSGEFVHGDFDGDGVVDVNDLVLMEPNWA